VTHPPPRRSADAAAPAPPGRVAPGLPNPPYRATLDLRVPITTQRSTRGSPRLNATTMRDGSPWRFACARVTKWERDRRHLKIPDPSANALTWTFVGAEGACLVALIIAESSPKQRRERFDWHGVTFWSCLAVAILLVGLSQLRRDRRIPTIFDREGQGIMRNAIHTHFPAFAKTYGVAR
jgi:hypothetical protein